MSITAQQSRAARAFLGWSQAQLAAKLKCASSTIAAFELGVSSPQPRLMEALIATLESAGIVFIEPREGEHGLAVGLKWGFTLPQRQPGEGTAAGAAGEGMKLREWLDELGLRPFGRTLVKPNLVAAGPMFRSRTVVRCSARLHNQEALTFHSPEMACSMARSACWV